MNISLLVSLYRLWKYQCIAGIFVMMSIVWTMQIVQWSSTIGATSLALTITNSYTGSLTLDTSSGTWYLDSSNNIYRTTQYQAQLTWWASDTSSYELSWDFINSPYIWNETGNYVITTWVNLTTGQMLHQVAINYLKGLEPLNLAPITIGVDQQAPSQTTLLIANNTVLTWSSVWLSWLPSVDTGVWLSQYTLLIWLTPSLASMIAINTSMTSVTLNSGQLAYGTYYRAVISTDHLWNQSQSDLWYFHYQAPTIITPPITGSTTTWYIPLWGGWQSVWQNVPSSSQVIDNDNAQSPNDSTYNPSITSDSHLIPVFEQNVSWDIEYHHAAECGGLRIDDYRYCVERDNFDKKKQIKRDDFEIDESIWISTVLAYDKCNRSLRVDDYRYCVERDNFPVAKKMKMIWDDFDVWRLKVTGGVRDNFTPNLNYQKSINEGEIPHTFDHLVDLLSSRYYESAPSSRILPVREFVISDSIPDPKIYEQILDQYWANYTPRTQLYTNYIIALSILLLSLSVWFFVGWYHHRYTIHFE